MKRLAGVVGAVVLTLTIGVGIASAAPDNKNVRSIPGADCGGQTVDLVTMYGSSAWDITNGRVFVLMGATRDGAWIVPLSNGQDGRDLATCHYTNFGHDDVIYGKWVSDQ